MIRIVDYGLGNIQAFADIYRRLNKDVAVARNAEDLVDADHLILPGVGAFDWAMSRLDASGMRDALERLVRDQKVPVLGVCVGMQMLARDSEEGERAGLGWVPGRVARFPREHSGRVLPVPHMGWNDIRAVRTEPLFGSLHEPRFYFLHSYYFQPDSRDDVLAVTNYGDEFASAVGVGNVYGTQFHPEKSHHWGVQLLRNFAEL